VLGVGDEELEDEEALFVAHVDAARLGLERDDRLDGGAALGEADGLEELLVDVGGGLADAGQAGQQHREGGQRLAVDLRGGRADEGL